VNAGSTPHLTIGSWFHTDNEMQGECLRQTISWMSAHLLEQHNALRKKPVRLYISGTNEWREYLSWPIAIKENCKLYLGRRNTLAPQPLSASAASAPASYIYDPRDPTPNVGGAIFAFIGAGAQDNKELEARKDVLIFSSAPLKNDLTMIGNAIVRLYVRSSLENTDFFARLCDVDKKGVSRNISDAIIRLTPGKFECDATGIIALDLKLHASAHTFKQGHRIRLQVSSGAHPRFARNFGTDEPIGSATTMVSAHQQVFHDPEHQSALTLPIVELG